MIDYVNLLRLEFIITFRCTTHCIHCYNAGTDKSCPTHIDKNMAVDALETIATKYNLDSLMTFGGEPLLYPEIVSAIHEKAVALGIGKRQVITNGYWTKEKSRTKKTAKLLALSGVNHVMISIDAFHQEWIPLDKVRYSAESLIESGITNIQWHPCWLVSSDADNQYNSKTRKILAVLAPLSIPISEGNVVTPEGGATTNLSEYFERKMSFPNVSCHELPYMNRFDDIKSICIEPDGNIPICEAFNLGNIKDNNIIKTLESYDPYSIPAIKVILNSGIQRFIEKSVKQGTQLDECGYYTICEMCSSERK